MSEPRFRPEVWDAIVNAANAAVQKASVKAAQAQASGERAPVKLASLFVASFLEAFGDEAHDPLLDEAKRWAKENLGRVNVGPGTDAPSFDAFDSRHAEDLKVLGLVQGATDDDIRTAYRLAALRWHPDRPGGNAKRMARINEAKARLLP